MPWDGAARLLDVKHGGYINRAFHVGDTNIDEAYVLARATLIQQYPEHRPVRIELHEITEGETWWRHARASAPCPVCGHERGEHAGRTPLEGTCEKTGPADRMCGCKGPTV